MKPVSTVIANKYIVCKQIARVILISKQISYLRLLRGRRVDF